MAKRPDEKYGLFINGEFRDSKDGKFLIHILHQPKKKSQVWQRLQRKM